jgi:hypothetical protein
MLVGSTDRTPLNLQGRQRYESNAGLARSRAERAKEKIHEQCFVPLQQMFTGIMGPAYTPDLNQGAPPSKGALDDRHVEVWAFWNTSPSSFEFKVGDKQEKKEDKRR